MFSRSRNPLLTFLQSYHVWVTLKIQVNSRFNSHRVIHRSISIVLSRRNHACAIALEQSCSSIHLKEGKERTHSRDRCPDIHNKKTWTGHHKLYKTHRNHSIGFKNFYFFVNIDEYSRPNNKALNRPLRPNLCYQ